MEMVRAQWRHRPERLPSRSPARWPATDTSWQGKPMVRTSMGGTWSQSMAVTSPRLGTLG
jgi:hypothetical protein